MYDTSGTYEQYRSLLKGLVRYVDRWNLGKSETSERCSSLDSAFCPQWYQSWDYSNSVMRRRWGVIRSFFTYLEQQGAISSNPTLSIRAVPKEHIYLNLPFTDRQYNDILNYAAVADPGPTGDSKVYRARLHIFELLRWTGMDIGDAIQFRPSMIDADGVLRYIRTKTGIQAVIPLEPHMIELLHPAELCARCKQHALAEERRAAMPQTEPSTPAEPEEVEVKKIPIVDRERAKKLAQNFRLENCCALLKRP